MEKQVLKDIKEIFEKNQVIIEKDHPLRYDLAMYVLKMQRQAIEELAI